MVIFPPVHISFESVWDWWTDNFTHKTQSGTHCIDESAICCCLLTSLSHFPLSPWLSLICECRLDQNTQCTHTHTGTNRHYLCHWGTHSWHRGRHFKHVFRDWTTWDRRRMERVALTWWCYWEVVRRNREKTNTTHWHLGSLNRSLTGPEKKLSS